MGVDLCHKFLLNLLKLFNYVIQVLVNFCPKILEPCDEQFGVRDKLDWLCLSKFCDFLMCFDLSH